VPGIIFVHAGRRGNRTKTGEGFSLAPWPGPALQMLLSEKLFHSNNSTAQFMIGAIIADAVSNSSKLRDTVEEIGFLREGQYHITLTYV